MNQSHRRFIAALALVLALIVNGCRPALVSAQGIPAALDLI